MINVLNQKIHELIKANSKELDNKYYCIYYSDYNGVSLMDENVDNKINVMPDDGFIKIVIWHKSIPVDSYKFDINTDSDKIIALLKHMI